MTENLQYRLYNASINPPDDAWPHIAEQLDHEVHQGLSLKLQQAALTPPPGIWENISEVLDESNRAKVIPITRRWTRLAVAAVAAGLIVLAGLFYFMSDNSNNKTASDNTKQQTTPPANNDTDVNNNNNIDNSSSTQPRAEKNFAGSVNSSTASVNRRNNARIRYARVKIASLYNADETDVNIEDMIHRPVSVEPETNVSPRNYLTIAAPNGQPAKISAKFRNAMSYLVANEPAENMDGALRSISWRIRFSNWSNKLMSQPSFIPSATNFFDIIELEELLKE